MNNIYRDRTRLFFVIGYILLLAGYSTQILAQSVIPRDTSFTVYQAYQKEKKKLPYIEIIPMELQPGTVAFEDITYSVIPDSPYGNRELQLNLYRPDNNEKYPALLMVHGGGWNSGDRSLQIPLAQHIATYGYVTIPVEYRLIPEALYPAGLHDIKTAVRWIRANAGQYGIDTTRIAISGCSAGAQLASLVGMTNGSPQHEDKREYPDFSSEVHAVVNIDGILDFTVDEIIVRAAQAQAEGKKLPVDALWLGGVYEERKEVWEEASSIYWVTERAVPICFINSLYPQFHYGRDILIEKLDKYGLYHEKHQIEEYIHPFWFFHPWFDSVVKYTTDFLDKVLPERSEESE